MSMLNLDGQLVASALLHQQAGEVAREIINGRNARKVDGAWQQHAFALEQNLAQIVARYNNLADRYNAVIADNRRVDAAHAVVIAEKDRRIAQLVAESEERRRSAYDGWTKVGEALDEIKRLKTKAGDPDL